MHPHEYGLTRVRYGVNETLLVLSTSRATLYGRLIAEGHLRPLKEGKKTFFLAADIAAYLDKLKAASVAQSTGRAA